MNAQPEHHIAFGPVPSRRLVQSLGINNITAKTCSYTCIYCQVGQTTEKIIEPRPFFSPRAVHAAVAERVREVRERGLAIDYLTFVPDGEPTLDSRLGESIARLRELGIPIAVISNATLLWRSEVRARLAGADLVSLKVDSVHPMREDAVRRLLHSDRADWALVDELLRAGLLEAVQYQGARYFLRPVPRGGR